MKFHALALGIVLFVALDAASCFCQESPYISFSGYVTRVFSSNDFDVNGFRVLLRPKARLELKSGKHKWKIAPADLRPYFGQAVEVYGKVDKSKVTVTAITLTLSAPVPHEVDGFGIIDSVLTGSDPKTEHLLRADGYRVLISPRTAVAFNPPLDASTAYRPNVWMSFHGSIRADGIVEADQATLQANTAVPAEETFRNKMDYDPKSVNPKQSGLSKAFLPFDPKKLPPYIDDAMQSRLNAIGEKLIPRYMRDLPDTDPGKINFRFQLVDKDDWHDAMPLPSGIILVPHQVVKRTQNDSQLATVLADNIAAVLEEQAWRDQPALQKKRAAYLSGTAGGLFVPGLGLGTYVSTGLVGSKIEQHREEQRGRVSLGLVKDAGYDIHQAPLAWLRLERADGDVSPFLPRRAAYLYKMLGEMWNAN